MFNIGHSLDGRDGRRELGYQRSAVLEELSLVRIIKLAVLRAQESHFQRKGQMAAKLSVKLAVVIGGGYPLWLLIREGVGILYGSSAGEQDSPQLIKLAAMLLNRATLIGLLVLVFRRELRVLFRWLGTPCNWRKGLLVPLVVSLSLKFFTLVVPPTMKYWLRPHSIDCLALSRSAPEHRLFLFQFLSALFGLVVSPVFEEMLFRGIVFLLLVRVFGKWPAIGLGVFAFAFAHPSSWIHMLDASAAGACAFFVLLKTRRLSSCVLFHSLDNAILGIAWILMGLPLSHGIWMV